MALVVFLRGVNVGGHKTFRPSVLAKDLRLDAVNIGAAGTFVIRKPVSRTNLRSAVRRGLPFDADIMICDQSEILRLASANPFERQVSGPSILHFVSVLAKRTRHSTTLPVVIPAAGAWGVRIFSVEGRFVLGVCRREMRAIGHLGQVEKIFGVPVTTRSWNTILAIARTLKRE